MLVTAFSWTLRSGEWKKNSFQEFFLDLRKGSIENKCLFSATAQTIAISHISRVDGQLHETMDIVSGTIQSTPAYWLPVLQYYCIDLCRLDLACTTSDQSQSTHFLPLFPIPCSRRTFLSGPPNIHQWTQNSFDLPTGTLQYYKMVYGWFVAACTNGNCDLVVLVLGRIGLLDYNNTKCFHCNFWGCWAIHTFSWFWS